MTSLLFLCPFIVHGEASEGTVTPPENYLVNGELFQKDPASNEHLLILQNGKETLTLRRDGCIGTVTMAK